MSSLEVKTDPYDQLFERPRNTNRLTKIIMIIYYFTFNALLMCIAVDSYYEFMEKKDWFVAAISLIVLNNCCQFLRYICTHD